MICTIRNGEYISKESQNFENFGLANSMFRIATGYSCAKRLNTDMVCKNLPGYREKYSENIFRNVIVDDSFNPKKLHPEQNFHYDEIIGLQDGDGLWGYWQSEKYFKDFESEIKDLFSPTDEIVDYINSKYGDILENSVSIHSRRGDYLVKPQYHPTCGMEYYNSAISHFGHRKNFLVFGDDLNWLIDNFDDNFHIIQETDVIDLYIMSMCTDNIIANSTFSWWGAWLNSNEDKKVIAPKQWFGSAASGHNTKDLIPNSWITI